VFLPAFTQRLPASIPALRTASTMLWVQITQVNTRTFDQSFNKMGPYPSGQQVRNNHETLKELITD